MEEPRDCSPEEDSILGSRLRGEEPAVDTPAAGGTKEEGAARPAQETGRNGPSETVKTSDEAAGEAEREDEEHEDDAERDEDGEEYGYDDEGAEERRQGSVQVRDSAIESVGVVGTANYYGDSIFVGTPGVADIHGERPSIESIGVVGTSNIHGDQKIWNISYGDPARKPQFSEIGDEDIQWYRGVFVEPDGYRTFIESSPRPEPRVIFIVHGSEGSGKLTCAVNLAWRLRGWAPKGRSDLGTASPMRLYERPHNEVRSALAAIEEAKLPGPSILILEDAFDKNISLAEFEAPAVHHLSKELAARKLVLILTTEKTAGDLSNAAVARIDAKAPEQKKLIFDQHLDCLVARGRLPGDLRKLAAGCWPHLLGILQHPAQIGRFFEELAAKVPRTKAAVVEIALQVTEIDRTPLHERFEKLSRNDQLLAMLVYLLEGAQRRDIETIYLDTMRRLRSEGMDWLADPTAFGLDDALGSIEAQAIGPRVEFKRAPVKEQARVQVANRRHLLWPILEQLVSDCGTASDERDRLRVQAALGMAAGRMAALDPQLFARVVRAAAGDPRREVVAACALEEAVRGAPESALLQMVAALDGWTREADPQLLATAAGAIGRMYQEIARCRSRMLAGDDAPGRDAVQAAERGGKERAQRLENWLDAFERALRGLAIKGVDHRHLSQAVLRMSSVEPARTAKLLAVGLRQDDGRLRQAAKAAVFRLFAALARRQVRPQAAKYRPLLDLAKPVLDAAGADSRVVRQMFSTLQAWLVFDDWRPEIRSALLAIANLGGERARQRLRDALAAVWRHGPAAQGLARRLIARSYAMDGTLMDRPNFGQGLLLIDPAFISARAAAGPAPRDSEEWARALRRADRGAAACRYLIGLLEAQIELSVAYLGQVASRTTPGAGVGTSVGEDRAAGATSEGPGSADSTLPAAPDYPVPRLLMPALEQGAGSDLSLVMVITCGPLWDLEDALGYRRAQDLFLVAAAPEAQAAEGVERIPLDSNVSAQSMQALELRLRLHWARALAAAEPEAWRPVLASFGVNIGELAAEPVEMLEEWATGLGEPSAATGRTDLARRILCCLAWFAAVDLQRCVALLARWLEAGHKVPEDEPKAGDGARAQRACMAAAGAKMLLEMHSAARSPETGVIPGLLFDRLSDPLAAHGRDGAEALLRAVRRWMEDPVWAAYLAGGVVDGRGRLLRWADRFMPDQREALAAALPPLDLTAEAILARDEREALAAQLDRLRLRIVSGAPLSVPELEAGKQYALIVLDAAEPDDRLRERFAVLARDLFSALPAREVQPVIFRLGERRPAWVATRVPPTADLLARSATRMPRLLGPLLSAPGLSPGAVRYLLVLAARPLVDGEDWLTTPWRERMVFFRDGLAEVRQPAFAELPPSVAASAETLVRYLRRA